MTRLGANQPGVGSYNQALVLDHVRRSGSLSRVELAASTGLSAQTVSNIAQRLLDQGIIEEAGRPFRSDEPPRRGKPRTLLRLVPGSRFAVGVHLDPSLITTVVLSIDGSTAAHHSRPTPRESSPDVTVRLMADEIDDLLTRENISRERIVGVGIATPGPIDVERGLVLDPPNLEGWNGVPLRDAVAHATDLPVLLEKDVTAAVVAERWNAHGETPANFAFMYLGTGLGVGLVLADDVVRGASGNAGEIGHIIVDPDGPPCPCGLRGCVAVTCTPAVVVSEATDLGLLPPTTASDPHSVDLAFSSLVALAEDGNTAASGLLHRLGVRISRAIAAVCNLLDLDDVILGGPIWTRFAPWGEPAIRDTLPGLMTVRPDHTHVTGTRLGDEVGAYGAASLVLDDALSPRPAAMILGRSRLLTEINPFD